MLKRFVADMDLNHGGPYMPKTQPATGHRVAVIGGGPGRAVAAYYLALEGHMVPVSKPPALGGMLRYGIPEYRFPKLFWIKKLPP